MKNLSHVRKKFYIFLALMIAGLAACAILISVILIAAPSEETNWDGWDARAIEHLQEQEEITERYSDEYIFRCTRAYYGYTKGVSMYGEDGEPLPTDVEITITVRKDAALSSLFRDDYTVYFLRNEDGSYRVDRYETRYSIGSLILRLGERENG